MRDPLKCWAHRAACIVLTLLGLLNITGYLVGSKALTLAAYATALAPFPCPTDNGDTEWDALQASSHLRVVSVSGRERVLRADEFFQQVLKNVVYRYKIAFINGLLFSEGFERRTIESFLRYAFCEFGPIGRYAFAQERVAQVTQQVVFHQQRTEWQVQCPPSP